MIMKRGQAYYDVAVPRGACRLNGPLCSRIYHTLHFVQHPTPDQREALSSYMYLTSRLYPCGECAAEFQELLKKFPPQVSTTFISAMILCL